MKYQCLKCKNKEVSYKNDKYYCDTCNEELLDSEVIKIINVSHNKKNGQHKCASCGSSEILFNEVIGCLECKYCGCLFKEESEDGKEENKIKGLKGTSSGEASLDIDEEFNNIVTIKCGGCGAEVVVDASDNQVFRCQWCRSILSLDNICDSGLIPDKILPFKLTKEEALSKMKSFLETENRDWFSHEEFKNNLQLDNIIGVYMPYMLVDVNAHSKLKGIGKEILNYKKNKKHKDYDINTYEVEREFDLYIDDLSLESNSSRKNLDCDERANNILNAVMPFDTENALKYKGNYLMGYNAEKRDLNQKDLELDLKNKVEDISKTTLKKDRNTYNGGIEWDNVDTKILGTKWMSIYLPIWLYSYQENHEDRRVLHYVAVNGRSGKTMGSAPLNEHKMKISNGLLVFAILCIISPLLVILFLGLICIFKNVFYIFLILLFLVIVLIIGAKKFNYKSTVKYLRNKDAKYDYEKNTKKSFSNIKKTDKKIN